MTIAPLPTSPMPVWLASARAAMSAPFDASSFAPDVARSIVAEMSKFEAQWAARKLSLIRVVDEAEVAQSAGATSTGAMLSGDFGGDQAASARQVRTAQNLRVATMTERALEAGNITFEKAAVIARTMADLPTHLDELTRTRVEKRLLVEAKIYSLPNLRRQEARAWQATELWIGPVKDGKARFGGELPALYAELLRNQVGAIAAPRRNDDCDGDLTSTQRMGRAFCGWIERIPTDGLPATGGTPATLTVNLDYDALTGKVREAAGMLAAGERVSASEIRRLACTHGILPRVLDGKSVPLDQGRAKRLFTPAQRLAMADRDGGCTYPRCDRPPAWTEAHHIDHWAEHGGNTDLDRGTLLCARHHHWVHSEDIHIRSRHGHTEFRIDGVWKRNHRWRP